jgi:hypothetical protein
MKRHLQMDLAKFRISQFSYNFLCVFSLTALWDRLEVEQQKKVKRSQIKLSLLAFIQAQIREEKSPVIKSRWVESEDDNDVSCEKMNETAMRNLNKACEWFHLHSRRRIVWLIAVDIIQILVKYPATGDWMSRQQSLPDSYPSFRSECAVSLFQAFAVCALEWNFPPSD